MTAKLYINTDGANSQAQAVLAYIREEKGVQASWDSHAQEYNADPKVSRWENGREQGYVIWMRSYDYKKQINIAFFEHRNSEEICAVVWEQLTSNAPNIENMDDSIPWFKNKYDFTKAFPVGKAMEMAIYIDSILEDFWEGKHEKLD